MMTLLITRLVHNGCPDGRQMYAKVGENITGQRRRLCPSSAPTVAVRFENATAAVVDDLSSATWEPYPIRRLVVRLRRDERPGWRSARSCRSGSDHSRWSMAPRPLQRLQWSPLEVAALRDIGRSLVLCDLDERQDHDSDRSSRCVERGYPTTDVARVLSGDVRQPSAVREDGTRAHQYVRARCRDRSSGER